MVLKLLWAQDSILWAFENNSFKFFATFWLTKVRQVPGKVGQSDQNYLNWNFVTWSFLGNGFEATLSPKPTVLSVWKGHFSVLFQIFYWGSWTIFRESEARHQNLIIGSFLLNGFWSYFELKTDCSECMKKAFFSFLQIFDWRSLNNSLGNWGKTSKTV